MRLTPRGEVVMATLIGLVSLVLLVVAFLVPQSAGVLIAAAVAVSMVLLLRAKLGPKKSDTNEREF